ncbi:MAG TPA: sigma-70 family RNA polymerase sigma factor [Terriglobia bacterium]|nr:sigma-70 family RNA polymerase sigma factor [Terriglobia bacterium]
MTEALNPSLARTGSGEAKAREDLQEEAWVTASQKGDTLAFNRLVLKWEGPIYNLALRMLQHEDEAAEATQEVFLLAFRNIGRFRRESRFSTWLYRIASNHCTTHLRQRPVEAHCSLDDDKLEMTLGPLLPVEESHEKELLNEESRQRVARALGRLSPEQRIVVELKFFKELTFEEISQVVQVPLSTVKTRLYSGLEALKSRLGRTDRGIKRGLRNDKSV